MDAYQNQAEVYVPPLRQREEARTWYAEKGLPFDSSPDDAQGTSSEETSQAAMETHQGGQDKEGMEPLTSDKEKL